MEKPEDDETATSKTLKRQKRDGSTPNLPLVSPDGSGKGLPYAPEDWPNKGDTWTWRVGRRIASNGHFLDRYLYPPPRLRRRHFSSSCRRSGFASKLSVERFLRSAFPNADVDSFFRSFSWKIPAKPSLFDGCLDAKWFLPPPSEDLTEDMLSDSQTDGLVCKAKNKNCESVVPKADKDALVVVTMPCDICCSEPRFCRDCCCVLCCKTVSSSFGGYSYIKCEAVIDGGYICGHVAHLNCALRTYMAGTVGGTIGLDAEYYCRRCDVRTSLVPHVMKLLQSCEAVDSRADVEKMLNLGVCILRGSQRNDVKGLLKRIELAISKLKCGTNLKDIWKDGETSVISTEVSPMKDETMDCAEYQDPSETLASSSDSPSETTDFSSEIVKIEDEINLVLEKLRKSQEAEFMLAEERLHTQKRYLHNLYQQLDKERSNLLSKVLHADKNALEYAISSRMDQIKGEVVKLKDMEAVANGFGKTSKKILKEFFGSEVVE